MAILSITIVPLLSTNAGVLHVALMSAKSEFRFSLGLVETLSRLLMYPILFHASAIKTLQIGIDHLI